MAMLRETRKTIRRMFGIESESNKAISPKVERKIADAVTLMHQVTRRSGITTETLAFFLATIPEKDRVVVVEEPKAEDAGGK